MPEVTHTRFDYAAVQTACVINISDHCDIIEAIAEKMGLQTGNIFYKLPQIRRFRQKPAQPERSSACCDTSSTASHLWITDSTQGGACPERR